jgi:ribonuclease HII
LKLRRIFLKINSALLSKELLEFDKAYGISRIAGIDEAGRGPLAGPVTAACVIMPLDSAIPYVNDSKKLSEKRREMLFEEIIKNALYVDICSIPPETIDEINILNATRLAMENAANKCSAELFLVDYIDGLKLPGKIEAIVKGDAKSYNIACAGIVAKVSRDRYMRDIDKLYPEYGFARHKGYGTKVHIEAIKKYGPSPIHRRSFITKFT